MKRVWWIAVFVVACGKDHVSPPPITNPGTFVLQSVNGRALPAGSIPSHTVTNGRVELRVDGTYQWAQRDSVVGQPAVAWSIYDSGDIGSWTQKGDSVLMTTQLPQYYPNRSGKFTADGLELRVDGQAYRYLRP